MNLYQTIIEDLSQENEQLLFLLGIPMLATAPILSEVESRLRGPSQISLLSDRNRVLRNQLLSTLPTLSLDTYLHCNSVH